MISTLLVGINNMYEFQSKRDQHRNAAKACQTLKHSFVNNVEVPIRMGQKSEESALVDFALQVEQAVGDHPMVPAWVRKKFPVVMSQTDTGMLGQAGASRQIQEPKSTPEPLGAFVQRMA